MKNKTLKHHRYDESLVIAVMIASALCILILIAQYISVTGQAVSVVPTNEGVLQMLNSAEVIKGDGNAICDIKCGSKTCVLAKLNGKLRTCEDKLSGSFYCVCASPP